MSFIVVTTPCFSVLVSSRPVSHVSTTRSNFTTHKLSKSELLYTIVLKYCLNPLHFVFHFCDFVHGWCVSSPALQKTNRTSARLCVSGSTPLARHLWSKFSTASPRSRRKSWVMPWAPCRITFVRAPTTRKLLLLGGETTPQRTEHGLVYTRRTLVCGRVP